MAVRSKTEVYRVAIPKETLSKMPAEERNLFLLLGYAANQITLFRKLLIFSTNDHPEDTDQSTIAGAQTQMILRILVGVIAEGYELTRRLFLKQKIAKEYVPLLTEEDRAALERLSRYFGSQNLLHKLRNNYAFHHPYDVDLDGLFASAIADKSLDGYWNWYIAHSPINVFYLMSDFVITHGMMQETGEKQPEAALRRIMTDIGRVGDDLIELIGGVVGVVWKKHFGAEIEAQVCADIAGARDLEAVIIPVFVRTAGRFAMACVVTVRSGSETQSKGRLPKEDQEEGADGMTPLLRSTCLSGQRSDPAIPLTRCVSAPIPGRVRGRRTSKMRRLPRLLPAAKASSLRNGGGTLDR